MTFDRWATSRTSTSTSASMKSGWRLTIFRLATAPSCLAMALVRLASAVGSLRADHADPRGVAGRLAVGRGRRSAPSWFQSTSMKRSGVAAKPVSVWQSRPWIVTPLPVVTMPTMSSPGTGWQQPAK